MLQEIIMKGLKPLLDAEYNRGYSAGVTAEKVVKEKEWQEREYDLLCRGIELGRDELLRELEQEEVEEISAREFEELAGMNKEPFGFVGTLDDLSLVLDEEVSA